MDDNDLWLAPDKLHHVLFCFSFTLLFSTLAARTRYPFLRRHSIRVGSILSLLAGAAKEFADELGFFRSAGASAKDAAADILGVLIGSLVLYLIKYTTRPENETGRIKEDSMVWSGFWVSTVNGVVWFFRNIGGFGLVGVVEEEEFVWMVRKCGKRQESGDFA